MNRIFQFLQHLNYWDQEEAAAATTRLNAAESRYAQATISRLLMVKEKAIHHHQHVWNSPAQAEHSYRATVQQEVWFFFFVELSQELLYHQTAQAQAEFTLAAEKQCSQHTLQGQTEEWKKLWVRFRNGEKRPFNKTAP